MNFAETKEMIDTVNKLSMIVEQLTRENQKLKKLIESKDIELAIYDEHKILLHKLYSISNLGGGEVRGGDGVPRGGGGVPGGGGARSISEVRDNRDPPLEASGDGGGYGFSRKIPEARDAGGRGVEVRGDRGIYEVRENRDPPIEASGSGYGFSRKIPEARDAGGGGVEVSGPRSALSTAVGDRRDGRAGGRTDDRSGDSRTLVRESKETRLEASDGSHRTRLRDVLDKSPLAMVTSGDNKKALTDMETRTRSSIHTIFTGLSSDPKSDRVRKESHTNDHGGASGASGGDRVVRFGKNEEREY